MLYQIYCYPIIANTHQSIITLVFFISYTIFQPPATVLCRKIGPRVFLSTITLAWGIVMIGFGFVKGWEALVGLRLILGILEVNITHSVKTRSLGL